MISPSAPAASAGDQDPQLAATLRLMRRRRGGGWTAIGGFLAALTAISVYSAQTTATSSGPVATLAIATALAALTVAGLVDVVATSVRLRRHTAAQRAQATSIAERKSERWWHSWRSDLVTSSALLVIAVGTAALFTPGLVNSVGWVTSSKMATFDPQFHDVSCGFRGQGGCSIVTVGILETGGGGVHATWPHSVQLGRPFQVREPLWPWGPGTGLIDGDGAAATFAIVSLLADGLAVLAAIFFAHVVGDRLHRNRADPAPGLS